LNHNKNKYKRYNYIIIMSSAIDPVMSEINSLLKTFEQSGGGKKLLKEINSLMSEYGGSALSEDGAFNLAQKGGVRRKRKAKKAKSKAKSKAKKSRSKSKKSRKMSRKSKSSSKRSKKSSSKRSKKSSSKRSKKSSSKRSKSKRSKSSKRSLSRSKKKSAKKSAKKANKSTSKGKKKKSRSKSRSKSKRKQSRGVNPFMVELIAVRRMIKSELSDEVLNNVGAMSSAASKLLKATKLNDKVDAKNAMKNFDKKKFMANYKLSDKAIKAKRAAKKASKKA
jgi:cobalamin biosynthesis Mg chelatase CobN